MDAILRSMVRLGASLPGVVARATAAALGDRDHGLRELANKVRAYERFVTAPDPPPARLAAAVAGLGDWDAVWVKEGVGYRWGAGEGPGGRLRDPGLPDDWLLPLHTGAGLALAVAALERLSWRPDRGEVAVVLGGFRAAVGSATRPGWRLAALEALGLAAATLHPHRLGELDAAAAAAGGALRRALWHGVGRGSYFAPRGGPPFPLAPSGRRVDELAASAPDGEASEQAVAGWAWALALVNLRHPEVVAAALAEPAADGEAFADGVGCALAVWLACGGSERRIERFVAHRPGDPTVAAAWRPLAVGWAAALVARPRREDGLGGLFVHRPGRWHEAEPWREPADREDTHGTPVPIR